MRCHLALAILSLALLRPAARAADEEDPVVLKKKASEWMQLLKEDKEPRRRKIALLALDMAGPRTKKIFGAVGRCLREDADEEVRVEAAFRLGNLAVKAQMDKDRVPTDEAVDFLTQSVKNEKAPAVRQKAAEALTGVGLDAKDSVDVLGAALKEPHPGLRGAAAECLGKLEVLYRQDKTQSLIRPVLESLITALKESKGKDYVRARGFVIFAIGRIGSEDASSAVPVFVEVLKEPDAAPENRRAVCETLGQFGGVGAPATPTLAKLLLEDKTLEVKQAAAAALDQFGVGAREAIPELIKCLQDKDVKDRYIRSSCIHALGQMGKDLGDENTPKVIQLFRDSLKATLPDVRLAAINGLVALGPDVIGKSMDAVKADLKTTTRDTQPNVREAAEAALKALEGNP